MFFSGDRQYPNNCPFSAHVLPGKWDVDLSINARLKKKRLLTQGSFVAFIRDLPLGFLIKNRLQIWLPKLIEFKQIR